MTPAATTIMTPSSTAEKYSALVCPKLWPRSAGRAAILSATKAAIAAMRFTDDSAASDSRPTEPVSRQAITLSPMVSTPAATATSAYLDRSGRSGAFGP